MLSFAHPAFLYGLGLLAVPVLLHLMRRPVAVTLVFPSVRFIRKGRLPHAGRRRLRDRFMLAARLLALAALVLAFARPRWRPPAGAAAGAGTADGLGILLVDMSPSMGGWAAADQARAEAARILDAHPRLRFALIPSADTPRDVLPPGGDTRAVRAAVEALQPGTAAGNHAAALRQAIGFLAAEPAGGTLFILSDFQAEDWPLDDLPRMPPGCRLELIRVGGNRQDNAAVLAATVQPLPGAALRVLAEVRNSAPLPAVRTLALAAGNEEWTRRLELPPQATVKAVFAIPAPAGAKGELRLDPDAYAADDRLHLWLGGPPPVTLLAVLPSTAAPEAGNEFFFVSKALAAQADSAVTAFDLRSVDARSFMAVNPTSLDGILILGAAGEFQEPDFALLKRFLEDGGTVLCSTPETAPGPQFMGLRRHGLLTADFQGIVNRHPTRDTHTFVAALEPGSPLDLVFDKPEDTDLFAFPVYRYARVVPQGLARPVLRLEDGDPLLVAQDVGAGRLYAFTVGFGGPWSDLPLSGAFLPLLRGLLADDAARDRRGGVLRLACGEPLPAVYGLNGKAQPPGAPDDTDTEEPGILMAGGRPVEINVSRRESSVADRSLIELRQALMGTAAAPAGTPQPVAGNTEAGVRDLWPWLAAAAGLAFLIEGALAAAYDRREAGRPRLETSTPTPDTQNP